MSKKLNFIEKLNALVADYRDRNLDADTIIQALETEAQTLRLITRYQGGPAEVLMAA
jgi:hypothetical protein